jgi:hypothetical protein
MRTMEVFPSGHHGREKLGLTVKGLSSLKRLTIMIWIRRIVVEGRELLGITRLGRLTGASAKNDSSQHQARDRARRSWRTSAAVSHAHLVIDQSRERFALAHLDTNNGRRAREPGSVGYCTGRSPSSSWLVHDESGIGCGSSSC